MPAIERSAAAIQAIDMPITTGFFGGVISGDSRVEPVSIGTKGEGEAKEDEVGLLESEMLKTAARDSYSNP